MSQENQWKILGHIYERWFQNYIVGLNIQSLSSLLNKENNEIAQAIELLQNNGLIESDGYGGYAVSIYGLDFYEESLPPTIISKKKAERKKVLESLLLSYNEDVYGWIPSASLIEEIGITDTYYLLAIVVYLEKNGLVNLELLNGGSFYIRLTGSGFNSLMDHVVDDSIVMATAYRILFQLENKLREHIENKMKLKFGSDWWEVGMSGGIKKKVDRMRSDELNVGWKVSKSESNMDYLMFEHFKGIISSNWTEIFSNIFHDLEKITLKLNELENIRNSIAHNRTLSDDALTRLQQCSDDIINLISK